MTRASITRSRKARTASVRRRSRRSKGWLHLAHGVRNTAAGMRYVLYLFLCDLHEPWKLIKAPGGYFMAPEGEERVGDVSNVVFANGWVARKNGDVFIYYGSSDTRTHVATSTVDKLLDYVLNTPEDGMRSKNLRRAAMPPDRKEPAAGALSPGGRASSTLKAPTGHGRSCAGRWRGERCATNCSKGCWSGLAPSRPDWWRRAGHTAGLPCR